MNFNFLNSSQVSNGPERTPQDPKPIFSKFQSSHCIDQPSQYERCVSYWAEILRECQGALQQATTTNFINKTIMGKREVCNGQHDTKSYKVARREFKQQLQKVMKAITKVKKESSFKNSAEMLKSVHKLIRKHRILCKPSDLSYIKQRIRVCRKCDGWDKQNSIWQCYICQDNLHTGCSSKNRILVGKHEQNICSVCSQHEKQASQCKQCTKHGKNRKEVLTKDTVLCPSCNFRFHTTCFKDNRCKKCEDNSKIAHQYQQSIKKWIDQHANTKFEEETKTTELGQKERRFKFKPMVHTEKEFKIYRDELMQAIKKKNMTYVESLIGIKDHQDKIKEGSMDFGMEYMTPSQEATYQIYKKQPIGPFKLPYSPTKGYDVVADKDIPKYTLICEYVGQVVTLRQCIELQKLQKNDSLMQLQTGRNSSQTLIIRPQNYTNIARFINGVKKDSSKGNVFSMRLLIKGKPCVLLVSSRQIRKGESLAYDYNAGGISAEYDTSHFV